MREPGLARRFQPLAPGCRGRLEGWRRPCFQRGEQLIENAAGAALHAQMAGKGPHRRAALEHVDIDVSPERFVVHLHIGRKPRRFDIDEQPDVGVGQRFVRRKTGKARALVGDVAFRVGFEDRNAGELRELVDFLRRQRIHAAITGDQDRVRRREQAVGERGDKLRVRPGAGQRAEPVGRKTFDVVDAPMLRQRLALHHQINRPARRALHDRISPLQRFLDDDAGRQRPLPFGVRPHQAALIERLLDEMHVGVAGADQFVMRRIGRLARHQQHRQAAAVEIVHGVGSVGRTDIDMHKHALAAAGDQSIAAGHVRGGVFVRAAHDVRHRLAAFTPMRHLLDDRRVIGAEITEQIVDADLFEALEQVIGAGEIANVGISPYRCVHG